MYKMLHQYESLQGKKMHHARKFLHFIQGGAKRRGIFSSSPPTTTTTITPTTKKAKLENIVLGECPICFEDVYKNTNVGHACKSCPTTCALRTKSTYIHDDCMRKSVQLNGKCPVCQTTCVDPICCKRQHNSKQLRHFTYEQHRTVPVSCGNDQ